MRLPQYYIVRTHTHDSELIIHRAAPHLSYTRKETRRARAGAWPLRRAAWAANNNKPRHSQATDDVTGLEVLWGVGPRHLVLVRQRNEVALEV